MDTGRLFGICEKVAVVGENAAAAERFEPDRGVGEMGSGTAEGWENAGYVDVRRV